MSVRIFYLCPDTALPSGGVACLYRHVRWLREEGWEAAILHLAKGFKPGWLETDVPVAYLEENPHLRPIDTLVFPEGMTSALKNSPPLRKVVIALNPLYIFQSLPLGENWQDYGVEWVITPSRVIADFVTWSMRLPRVYLFSPSVDHRLYGDTGEAKKLQVAYMSRKDTLSPLLEKVLRSRNREFARIAFVGLDNLPVAAYARVIRESAVYLTTSPWEGINQSVLEAMACGCLCAGFDGVGGKDYIVGQGAGQNFLLAESLNLVDLAQKLEHLLQRLLAGDPTLEQLRANARATAARYPQEAERESLVKFWQDFLGPDARSPSTSAELQGRSRSKYLLTQK